MVFLIAICFAATSVLSADWTLVWSDEFTGPAGQSPDAGNWDYDIGTDWGNAQLEYDTDRATNVSLDGAGNLAIIAREESYMGQPYTSARIVTRDLYEPTYGRIEARIKLPIGQGIWPAFWLLGGNFSTVGWPQCGEIDIMEYLGHEPNTAYGTLHGPGYSGGGGISQSYVLPSGQFNTDFHTFAVEWETDVIRWYVDDILYHTLGPGDLGGNEWVFDHPFYIIMNVAVGGNWPGPPDGTTVFPQTMLVDYVRVYQDSEVCCVVRGDVNHDGSPLIDIADLVYLVDYMFTSGPAPLCWSEGDIDASGVDPIDIGDLVYLVDYMFSGGPAPSECQIPEEPIFVFTDEFDSGVTYQAFMGSLLDALQIDQTVVHTGSRSLQITIPDAGNPSGSFSGGAFTNYMAQDLSYYNALTFWAKASTAATLDVAGIGNDNTGTSRYTAYVEGLTLTTSWQKYVIPFPLADRLESEQGLFWFAEGPEGGLGYQIWMDEIIFENLGTITDPRPALTTQTVNLEVGETFEADNGSVTFNVDGSDVLVSAMPGYFTFESSNEAVVTVGAFGTFNAVGVGTAVLSASLGTVEATGSITVNVSAPPDEPASPAPTPTVPSADVISLFSGVYTDHPVDSWSASWDMADVEDYVIGTDSTKKYTNLVFAGIEFASSTIDATAMTHFHMDVWTPDPTALPDSFRVKLVDFGTNGIYGGGDDVEHEMALGENTMNTGSWVSLDLALTEFSDLTTRGHLAQLIISGDPNTVYVDNIYFYTSGTPTSPTTSAPTPTVPAADVIALFSDAYSNHPVDTWSAVWDSAQVEDYLIGTDSTKKYTNLIFAGIEFKSSTVDASAMTHFHMDVWTPDATGSSAEFKVKLVDFGANGVWDGGGDDVEHELTFDESIMNTGVWVSLEIPLTDFSNLVTRGHLAQLILSGDPNTVYVDNVYFHK